jgi:hypothetical protein
MIRGVVFPESNPSSPWGPLGSDRAYFLISSNIMPGRRWQDTQLFMLRTISRLPVGVTGFELWVAELLASIFHLHHIYPALVAFPHQFHSLISS